MPKLRDIKMIVLDPPPRSALSKILHIRQEMARIYREARSGKLDVADATKLTFILMSLGKLVVDSDLELRIEKLEQEAENGKSNW